MNSSEAWFVHQRADSLAMMFLTRMPSLRVERLSQDMGIDYLVRVGLESTIFFGLEVIAGKSMHRLVKNSFLEQKVADKFLKHAKSVAFPVAVLAIDIATEEMRFGWINLNPATNSSKPAHSVSMQPATQEALKKACRDVKRWYEQKAL